MLLVILFFLLVVCTFVLAITNIDLLVKGLCSGHMTVTVKCDAKIGIESNGMDLFAHKSTIKCHLPSYSHIIFIAMSVLACALLTRFFVEFFGRYHTIQKKHLLWKLLVCHFVGEKFE